MSLKHLQLRDGNHGSSVSGDTTTVPSASSSRITVTPTTKHDESSTTSSYLSVPTHRPSRPSLDSAFSSISDLSFTSADLQPHRAPLNHSTSIRATLHALYISNYGALLVLLSQFFGSLMNLSTRLLETPGPHGAPMHPFQILFVRQSITATLCTVYALTSRSIPDFPLGPPSVRLLLGTRGLCGFLGVFGIYFSLVYLPLAEATVLTFLAPILTCYLCSWVIPGETFLRQQQWAGALSLLGVVFIARPATLFSGGGQDAHAAVAGETEGGITPPTAHQHLLAIGIAMIGVLGGTGAMTSIRAIGTRAHPFLSINYFSVFCTVVSLGCLIVVPDVTFRLPGNGMEWGLLASLGACGFVMQWLLTRGLSYGGVGEGDTRGGDLEGGSGRGEGGGGEGKIKGSGTRATSMVYTQMLFALAGDKLVFGVTPGTMSWIGSVLILAGAVWVAAARDKVKTRAASSLMNTDLLQRNDKDGQGEERVGLMSTEAATEEDDDNEGRGLELDELTSQPLGSTSLDT